FTMTNQALVWLVSMTTAAVESLACTWLPGENSPGTTFQSRPSLTETLTAAPPGPEQVAHKEFAVVDTLDGHWSVVHGELWLQDEPPVLTRIWLSWLRGVGLASTATNCCEAAISLMLSSCSPTSTEVQLS